MVKAEEAVDGAARLSDACQLYHVCNVKQCPGQGIRPRLSGIDAHVFILRAAIGGRAAGNGQRLDRPSPPVPVRSIRPAVAMGPVVGAVEWMPPSLDVVQHLPEDYQRPCRIQRRLAKLGS